MNASPCIGNGTFEMKERIKYKTKQNKMGLLTGKNALITGAARGIGKAIALKFASEGANIAFTDLVIDENGKKTEEEIAALGVKAKGYASNAANFEETAKVVEQVKNDFGSIDILVNNAGITKDNLMLKMTEEDFEQVIDTNLKGAFLCIKHVSKIMLKQKRGHIINISSVVGVRGNAGQVNYASSKAGLIGMTKSVAKEIGSRGITVNAVAPGFIETDMTAKLPEAVVEENLKSIPMKKLGKVEDVANLVRFLASDDASYIDRRRYGKVRGKKESEEL